MALFFELDCIIRQEKAFGTRLDFKEAAFEIKNRIK